MCIQYPKLASNLTGLGTRANLNYLDQLAKFHKQYGTNLNRFPSVDKRPLDLYKLKKAVEIRGGFEKVCKDKKWAEIGRDLGYSGKIMSSLSTSLKNSFQRWLHPYEEYLKTVKPGVQQQLELENGGPYTPMSNQSPPKNPFLYQGSPGYSMAPTPTMQASAALNAHLSYSEPVQSMHPTPPTSFRSDPPASYLPPPPPPTSSFQAINSGFSAINAPSSGFTAVNSPHQAFVKRESEASSSTPMTNGHTPVAPHQTTPSQYNVRPPPLPSTNGHVPVESNPLKRTISQESPDRESGSDELNGDDDSSNGRRSKRVKKDGYPMVPGSSHISQVRPSTPRMRAKSANRRQGEKCEQCSGTNDKEHIIVCESCELGYHWACLDPPLQQWPDYDWQCPRCLVGTGEYGFEEGGIYSLKQFQEKARQFKEDYFRDRTHFDPVTNVRKPPTEDEVEREFWRLVESLTEVVEVEYGADIHSTTHGSGFPTIEKNPLDKYSKDPWNLNVMPFLEESLFRHIKTDISGMTVPWLYVGMCFSTFCWHNEDHYTYSANYQHFGSTKTWYGIPGKDAHAFEDAMRAAVPELFESQPDLLFQLVTLLPPDQLRKAGVDVFALDQRAGQFVITFPQAYHAGFNHGFNFNEAVNFAPADWEPFGETGVERLQEFRKNACFSHDELLLTAAANDNTIKTARWLGPALQRMRDREVQQRQDFVARHKELVPHMACRVNTAKEADVDEKCTLKFQTADEELQEEEYQCYFCKSFTFLSQLQCLHSQRVSCLLHAETADCCAETPEQRLFDQSHTLKFRFSDDALSSMVQKVADKGNVPEAWSAKLDSALEGDAKPPLKSLHSLVVEGEKIPWDLPGLKDLSDFVKKCDAWVEEANQYLTRKQQNRRKTEKAWRRQSTRSVKTDDKEMTSALSIEKLHELRKEGEGLAFTCPQMEQLNEKADQVEEWQQEAQIAIRSHALTAEEIESLQETGRAFGMNMPELADLDKIFAETKWFEDARQTKSKMLAQESRSLESCKELIKRAEAINIPPQTPEISFFQDKIVHGEMWDVKAKEVMAMETVHFPQLESVYNQILGHAYPVSAKTMEAMDNLLAKNREHQKQINSLFQRSQDQDFRKRPMYAEVRDQIKQLDELNSKPLGTMDLERQLRIQEDWMRKGKKLFGKANAPLHILEQHLKFVEEKNDFCFDLKDVPRPPVEPSSRNQSPVDGMEETTLGEDEKPVFCICRQPESGTMIVCEACNDW